MRHSSSTATDQLLATFVKLMSMVKWLAAAAAIIVVSVVLFFSLRTKTEDVGSGGDPEARIVSYLKKNVKLG